MEIIEQTDVEIGDSYSPSKTAPRSPGLHVSDLISDLSTRMIGRKAQEARENSKVNNALCREVGFIWEEVLSFIHGAMVVKARPGELECDGIACSPDGVLWKERRLLEFKATWKSSRNSPLEHWYWMTQLKAYLYVLGEGFTEAEMHVLYLNGDYKGCFPIYRRYLIAFTPEEIKANWVMLLQHKEELHGRH